MITKTIHSRALSLLIKCFVLALVGLSAVYCIWGWFYKYYQYAPGALVPYFLLEWEEPVLWSLCGPLWIGLLVLLIGRTIFKYRLLWIAMYAFFVACGTLPVYFSFRLIHIDTASYQQHIYHLVILYDDIEPHGEGSYFLYECDSRGYLCSSSDIHYYGPYNQPYRADPIIADAQGMFGVYLTEQGRIIGHAIYEVRPTVTH